jgi:hypothetical protein
MSAVWIVVLALGGPPLDFVPPANSSPSPYQTSEETSVVPMRTGRELADATRAALRQWARVPEKDANSAAREFLGLYREIQADTKLAKSQREELRGKVRGRLIQVGHQISKRLAREKVGGPASVATVNSIKLPGNGAPLAQWGGGFAPGGFGGGGFGPGAGMGVGGQNQGVNDDGATLVELIQQVVSPTIWDANGGPASIQYWRGQRALIVAAPDDVQENVGEVLEQLRRASN